MLRESADAYCECKNQVNSCSVCFRVFRHRQVSHAKTEVTVGLITGCAIHASEAEARKSHTIISLIALAAPGVGILLSCKVGAQSVT